MKLKRLLMRVEAFLDAAERQRRAEKKEIRVVLKKLKIKERKLAADAAGERDDDVRAAIETRVKVVHAQRHKGLAALKAIKKQS